MNRFITFVVSMVLVVSALGIGPSPSRIYAQDPSSDCSGVADWFSAFEVAFNNFNPGSVSTESEVVALADAYDLLASDIAALSPPPIAAEFANASVNVFRMIAQAVRGDPEFVITNQAYPATPEVLAAEQRWNQASDQLLSLCPDAFEGSGESEQGDDGDEPWSSAPTVTPVWTYESAGDVRSTSLVDGEVIYFGNDYGAITAVTVSDGRARWVTQNINETASNRALSNGALYVSGGRGILFALDATTGDELWRNFDFNDQLHTPPVAEGNTVYVSSQAGVLVAFDATTGAILWKYGLPGEETSGAPVINNGVIYVGGSSGSIYAIDSTQATPIWQSWTLDTILSTPVVTENSIYVTSSGGSLHRLDRATGTIVWTYQTWQAIDTSPVIADGILYVSTISNDLIALDAETGGDVFRVNVGNWDLTTPAVAEGVVYVADGDGVVYALDATSAEPLWQFRASESISAAPAVANGIVYVGSHDNFLYALPAATAIDDGPAMVTAANSTGSMSTSCQNAYAFHNAVSYLWLEFNRAWPSVSSADEALAKADAYEVFGDQVSQLEAEGIAAVVKIRLTELLYGFAELIREDPEYYFGYHSVADWRRGEELANAYANTWVELETSCEAEWPNLVIGEVTPPAGMTPVPSRTPSPIPTQIPTLTPTIAPTSTPTATPTRAIDPATLSLDVSTVYDRPGGGPSNDSRIIGQQITMPKAPAVLWATESCAPDCGSPRIAGGILLIRNAGVGTLTALRIDDDAELWTFQDSNGYGISSPVISGDRVFAQVGNRTTAVDLATGALLWQSEQIGDSGGASLLPVGDYVFVSTDEDTLYALYAEDGRIIWQQERPQVILAYQNGLLIFQVEEIAEVVALDARTGQEVWQSTTNLNQYSYPVLYDPAFLENGQVILVASTYNDGDFIFAIDGATGKTLWSQTASGLFMGASIGFSNELVVINTKSGAAALHSSSGDVAWTNKEFDADRDWNAMRVSEGVAYVFFSELGDQSFAAIDVKTGATLWTIELQDIGYTAWEMSVGDGYLVISNGQTVAVYKP